MDSPLADVVQGYAELASSLLDEWSAHAGKVASALDDGSYDADGAAADLAKAASLATESWLRLASEALDALAVLTVRKGEPYTVNSERFSTSLAGAALKLPGPLVNGSGDSLPAGVIGIRPAQLAPADTDFSLRADATGYPAGAYLGTVVASTPGAEQSVTVWIIVA